MKKKHIIISIDAVKPFDNIQHPLMIKSLSKLATEGKLPWLDKGASTRTYKKLNGEKLDAFLLRTGTRQRFLFNTILEVLANTIIQENEIKVLQDWEGSNKMFFVYRWHDYLCRESQRTDKKIPGTNKQL